MQMGGLKVPKSWSNFQFVYKTARIIGKPEYAGMDTSVHPGKRYAHQRRTINDYLVVVKLLKLLSVRVLLYVYMVEVDGLDHFQLLYTHRRQNSSASVV